MRVRSLRAVAAVVCARHGAMCSLFRVASILLVVVLVLDTGFLVLLILGDQIHHVGFGFGESESRQREGDQSSRLLKWRGDGDLSSAYSSSSMPSEVNQ